MYESHKPMQTAYSSGRQQRRDRSLVCGRSRYVVALPVARPLKHQCTRNRSRDRSSQSLRCQDLIVNERTVGQTVHPAKWYQRLCVDGKVVCDFQIERHLPSIKYIFLFNNLVSRWGFSANLSNFEGFRSHCFRLLLRSLLSGLWIQY